MLGFKNHKTPSIDALVVTRNLPPLRGGMENVNKHLIEALAQDATVHVVGPSGCGAYFPEKIVCDEIPIRPLWRFLVSSLWRAVQHSRRCRPSVVVAGSGLTAPVAWIAARVAGARYAVYVHGLDLIVPHFIYRHLWLPFIRRCDHIIANSRHTKELAISAGVAADRIHIVHPGTYLTAPDPAAGQAFRQRHALGDRPLLLSVGRLTARKGLAEFVERAMPAILSHNSECCLVVIGDDAPNALTGGSGAKQALLDAIQRLSLQEHVKILGPCDDATLASAYEAADVLVFPVREIPGDVEGFGMVALEAAAHGVPTVAFAVGGVSDAVADGHSGFVVQGGDYEIFAHAVLSGLSDGLPNREACRAHAAQYTWATFGQKLRRLVQAEHI